MKALRELADALEELEVDSPWVLTGAAQTASAADPQASASASAPNLEQGKVPCGSSVQYHTNQRLYLVLANPESLEKIGLFTGQWKTLEASLRGGRLSGSGARLRKVDSKSQAQDMWRAHLPD